MRVEIRVPKDVQLYELESLIRAVVRGVSVLIENGRKMFIEIPNKGDVDDVISSLEDSGVEVIPMKQH